MPSPSPAARWALGSLAILVWLVFWIGAAVRVGELLTDAPWPVEMLYYAVAGIGWGLPLWPVFKWMRG